MKIPQLLACLRANPLPVEMLNYDGMKLVIAVDPKALEGLWTIDHTSIEYYRDGWRTCAYGTPRGWDSGLRVRLAPELVKAFYMGLGDPIVLNDGQASPGHPETPKQQNKEPHMAIKIQVKTFANGEDIAGLSNGAVLELIGGEEGAIARLKKLEAKPECIVKEIAKREAGIASLVAALNARKVDPADAE